MRRTRQLGGVLRAITLLGALSLVTGPTIGLAAWPAIELPPVNPIAVSGDGLTVVGLGVVGPAWRRDTGTTTPTPSILLWDTSYDGSFYPPEWTPHPPWAEAGGAEAQPWPTQFVPTGLSGDGTTYFGIYFDGDSLNKNTPVHAARFSAQSGLDTFGEVMPNWLAESYLPNDMVAGGSADGAVIVGGHPIDGKTTAFRWTQSEGITNLVQGSASNVSADGGTIIGFTDSKALFKWTEDDGLVILGTILPPLVNWAVGGVSADGSRIVATNLFWSAPTGTRDLEDVLVNWYGLDLAGHTSLQATDISDNGRVIVGEDSLGGFVVELPSLGDANGDDIVDGVDYVAWADSFLSSNSNWQSGDFNGDGITDGADYIVWAANFQPFAAVEAGALSTVSAVPEPAAFWLAAAGIICCGGLRARHLVATISPPA